MLFSPNYFIIVHFFPQIWGCVQHLSEWLTVLLGTMSKWDRKCQGYAEIFSHFAFISTIHQISKCSHLFSDNKNVSDLLIRLLELVCLDGCMLWQWTWLTNAKVLWSFCPCFFFFFFFFFFYFFSIHHLPEAVFPVCHKIGQALWDIISTDFAALKLSFWHKNNLNFY